MELCLEISGENHLALCHGLAGSQWLNYGGGGLVGGAGAGH